MIWGERKKWDTAPPAVDVLAFSSSFGLGSCRGMNLCWNSFRDGLLRVIKKMKSFCQTESSGSVAEQRYGCSFWAHREEGSLCCDGEELLKRTNRYRLAINKLETSSYHRKEVLEQPLYSRNVGCELTQFDNKASLCLEGFVGQGCFLQSQETGPTGTWCWKQRC